MEETEAGGDKVSDIYKTTKVAEMSARFLLSTIFCPITVTITSSPTRFVLLGSYSSTLYPYYVVVGI